MYHILHPVVLQRYRIRLEPLHRDHFKDLIGIGSQADIWAHLPLDGTNAEVLERELSSALLKRVAGEQYPFTIMDAATRKIIGSTRLYNFFPEHRKLEIGWTWYDPAVWGKGYNTECKLVLLTYCFEMLKCVRVQLQTGEQNQRSQAAIRKIGATFEGILRKERIRPDGSIRNTAVFSIIDDEWADVKQMLEQRVSNFE